MTGESGEMPFVGWLKGDGGAWMDVCRAETWAGCWRRLLPLGTDTFRNTERVVKDDGKHPDERRKPR